MPLSRKAKAYLILLPLAAILLFVGFQGLRFWWYRGYSSGFRSGVVRKVSIKGPPYCKYLSGELMLQTTVPGQLVEAWEFSVDDESDNNPLIRQLYDAEKTGQRVTLRYRQDLHSLFRCTPSEYFVIGIEY